MNKILQRTGDLVMFIISVILLSFAWALGTTFTVRRKINGQSKIVGRLRWFKYVPVKG